MACRLSFSSSRALKFNTRPVYIKSRASPCESSARARALQTHVLAFAFSNLVDRSIVQCDVVRCKVRRRLTITPIAQPENTSPTASRARHSTTRLYVHCEPRETDERTHGFTLRIDRGDEREIRRRQHRATRVYHHRGASSRCIERRRWRRCARR